MRHRDLPSAVDALENWRDLRRKVQAEGGQPYEKPVLVRFLDTNTWEVMDRDIVEDEFYVRRPFKVMRELAPDGADIDRAIRETRGGGGSQSQRRTDNVKRTDSVKRRDTRRGPRHSTRRTGRRPPQGGQGGQGGQDKQGRPGGQGGTPRPQG